MARELRIGRSRYEDFITAFQAADRFYRNSSYLGSFDYF